MSITTTKQEARLIEEFIGSIIHFISFEDGVAVFHTRAGFQNALLMRIEFGTTISAFEEAKEMKFERNMTLTMELLCTASYVSIHSLYEMDENRPDLGRMFEYINRYF